MRTAVATIILTASTIACGTPPNYITSHGINVFCMDDSECLSQNEVETITEIFIGLVSDSDALRQALSKNDLDMEIHTEPLQYCGSGSGECIGLYIPSKTVIQVINAGCYTGWPISHELAHYYQDKVQNFVDVKHSTSALYPLGCVAISETQDEMNKCIDATATVQTQVLAATALCEQLKEI